MPGICPSVLWAISDKNCVSVLPWGWTFLYVSLKQSLPVSLFRTFKRRLSLCHPQIQAFSFKFPPHLLLSGKPKACGFCLGSVWAILGQANLAFFLELGRTRISATRMSGQRVIKGWWSDITLTCVYIVANFILVTTLLRNRYFPMFLASGTTIYHRVVNVWWVLKIISRTTLF